MEVARVIAAEAQNRVVLVDCLSLLLNNWMFHDQCTEEQFRARSEELIRALVAASGPVIVVSNEVGAGIVPADALTRRYRDWLGWLNQAVAAVSESVIWMVAGIPVDVRRLQMRP
jgi:adenosylcobinamide kinase/adenosylcobinamide-phosphate guanylyltransferase